MWLVLWFRGLGLVVTGVQQIIQVNVAVLDVLSYGCLHELVNLEICFLDPLPKHLLYLLMLGLQSKVLRKGTLAFIWRLLFLGRRRLVRCLVFGVATRFL